MTEANNHVSAGSDYATPREVIANILSGVDGNGFLCDCTPTQRSAYLLRADAVLENWEEVTDGMTLPGDRFSYIGNSETGVGQITSHKRCVQRSPAGSELAKDIAAERERLAGRITPSVWRLMDRAIALLNEPQAVEVTPADNLIAQIETRFPNWRSYRDLLDCIDCTLHQLRGIN